MKKIINYLLIVVACLTVGCGSNDRELELGVLEATDSTVSKNQSDSEETAKNEENSENEDNSNVVEITVYICGAVITPGLYTFEGNTRIGDALDKAGGYSSDAHTSFINLAQVMTDGEKIYIPTKNEVEIGQLVGSVHESEAGLGKVNINSANKEQLINLSGVGDAKAESIIAYRTDYGDFTSIEEILNVSGIGEGVFSTIKDLITV